jgi:exopolysaccharide biosynthesis polyprenyl glycosylphosphotransferase
MAGFTARFGAETVRPWPNVILAVVLAPAWLLWVAGSGAYDARFFGTGSDEYRRVFNAGMSLTAVVAIVSYSTKADIARGYVVVALPLLTALDLLARYRLRKHLHKLRSQGECMRRVVVVGHPETVTDLIRQLARSPYHGMEIVAACLPTTYGDEVLSGLPVYGDLDGVAAAVRRARADTVAVLACPELDGILLRRLAWELEKIDTELFVAPALMDVAGPRTTIRPIAGLPLLHLDHPELAGARQWFKVLFDKVVAGLVLLIIAPAMTVIALIIRIADSGPAFFVQVRIGRDGREFRMLKFRTMIDGAELLRAELVQQGADDGVMFKLKDDPRITRIGGWLRRYSIDELPQLINVLRGDMSLVGPRPPLPDEVEQYGEDTYRRLVVKPGLTGLWQVSGRSDLPWEEAVRLDLRYVENWSLILDMQILWKTVAAVIRAAGAY